MSVTYSNLKAKVEKLIGAAIQPHTLIDQMLYGTSTALDEAHALIEKNTTPHIYTSLTGDRIDGVGMLVGCPRFENEIDSNYLARVMAHHTSNQAGNATAILMALTNLEYSSHASYMPFTQGVGTATIHFIPKHYDNVALAKNEISERIERVVSPDAFILIESAEQLSVDIIAYCVFDRDTEITRQLITDHIKEYINNIPIGETLSYSSINKIALNLDNVRHFNTVALYINGERLHALEKIQTVQEKFIFKDIVFEVANA